MDDLTFLVATISILILAMLWFRPRPSNGAPPLPPGPLSLPIVGYLPFLTPNLHIQFTKMAETYGPIFKLMLGSKLHVVINTPELVKEVVREQDDVFSNRNQPAAAFEITYGGQDIAFANNNPDWRKLRKIFVHEILSSKNLKAAATFRKDEVRRTVKDVFSRIGTAVSIRDVAFTTEANVLTRTICEHTSDKGGINGNIGSEIDLAAINIVNIIGKVNLSDFFPSIARFDLQGVVRDMRIQRDKLDKLFTNLIEDRVESNMKRSHDVVRNEEEQKDFIQMLLDHRDKDATLTITQMKAVLTDVMIAGTETTATTVEWTMACIMNDHKVMKKIQEELVEVVGLDNKVEESHLPQLKYLDATVKEALRLYPVVPFLLPRSPSKACTVGGYTIPKGCSVFLNSWSIHRDARYWDNPSEFNPERFLTDKWDYKGNNLAYFPFGAGRRLCAGIPLAEKMLMLILASLLHYFDWCLPEGEKHDLTEVVGIVLKKRKPLIAIPSQRLSDVSLYM